MDKGVKKVRKSIVQRKKMRGGIPKGSSKNQLVSTFPQEEEKHGYYPIFSDNTAGGTNKSNIVTGIVLKGILSVMLFFGVALLWQADSESFSKPKEWTSGVLTEEFPFARVNLWYQETFGSPLAFSPQSSQTSGNGETFALPVTGNVTESFQTNGKGIMIAPDEAAEVSVLNDGVVIFAGNDRETDKTVIVQHADGTTSSYGYLSEIDVHLYQFLTNNQRIGTFTPTENSSTVYFAIEKDNDYIDPVQVVQVDDQP